MNKQENNRQKILLFALLTPIVTWIALIIAGSYAPELKLFELMERITASLGNPTHIVFNGYSLKTALAFLCLYGMGVGVYFSTRENSRTGEEHGSAKWGNVMELAHRFADKNKESNLIFSQNMRLGLNGKKHRRNLNVLVVGGSGAGKTRFYAKPNVMQ